MPVQAQDQYDYNAALLRRIGMIQDIGNNATNIARAQASLRPSEGSQIMAGMPKANAYNPNPNQGRAIPTGFQGFLQAIAGQESGGAYGAQNKSSGALGKYQIMPSNLAGTGRGWDYEALGRDVSAAQFLASPQIQEAIAQYKLSGYYNKYGPAGAAVAWYAGPGTVSNYMKNPGAYTNPQGAYPSIAAYVQQILGRM